MHKLFTGIKKPLLKVFRLHNRHLGLCTIMDLVSIKITNKPLNGIKKLLNKEILVEKLVWVRCMKKDMVSNAIIKKLVNGTKKPQRAAT